MFSQSRVEPKPELVKILTLSIPFRLQASTEENHAYLAARNDYDVMLGEFFQMSDHFVKIISDHDDSSSPYKSFTAIACQDNMTLKVTGKCYQYQDGKYAVVGEELSKGNFGQVYASSYSISVSADISKLKVKKELKRRVIKRFFKPDLSLITREHDALDKTGYHVKKIITLPTNNSTLIILRRSPGIEFFNLLNDRSIIWSYEQKLVLTIKLLTSLQQIHAAGYVHLDLKPENVIVKITKVKISPTHYKVVSVDSVQIVDFGFARTIEVAKKGFNGGTPKYASPEVWSRKPITYLSDVYSVMEALKPLYAGIDFFSRVNLNDINQCIKAAVNDIMPSLESFYLYELSNHPHVLELQKNIYELFKRAHASHDCRITLDEIFDQFTQLLASWRDTLKIQTELKRQADLKGFRKLFFENVTGQIGMFKSRYDALLTAVADPDIEAVNINIGEPEMPSPAELERPDHHTPQADAMSLIGYNRYLRRVQS